jgi:hypothetical protein
MLATAPIDGRPGPVSDERPPTAKWGKLCEHLFAFRGEFRYDSPMTTRSDFSLKVVAHVCDGAPALRERLAASGLDTRAVAQHVGCSPLSLARFTKSGSTPRGVLVGMAALATVMDELTARGIGLSQLAVGGLDVEAAVSEVADQGPVAARTVARLRAHLPPPPTQLSLAVPSSAAA